MAFAEQAGDHSGKPLTFENTARKVFKTHCFHCHGEAGVIEGGLDLRLRRLMVQGGDSGEAITPHDAEGSYLLERMIDGDMPPEEVTVRPSDDEIELIRKWIEGGAKTARPEPDDPDDLPRITQEEREHWAFRPIVSSKIPVFGPRDRVRSPIDAFVLRRLRDHDRTFSSDADRRTLIRRAAFDLTGLPPTPDQVERFLGDDSANAYEQLVDRLLDSPAYGERWARHWLDVVGYADSEGASESDQTRPYAYKYRDYVISSLNSNKPFDQFIKEQLAGDEIATALQGDLDEADQQLLIATGFLRTAPDGTGANPDDADAAKNAVVAETIKIVTSSLMGLTVGCAQCHDHRYDPILHEDYYRIRAVFEPALNWKSWKTPQQRRIALASAEDENLRADVQRRATEAQTKFTEQEDAARQLVFDRELKKIPEQLREQAVAGFQASPSERTDEQKKLFADYPNLNVGRGSALDLYLELFEEGQERKKELAALKSAVGKIRSELPSIDYIRGLTEGETEPPTTYVFHRGDPTQPTDSVLPGSLSVLDHLLDVDLPANDGSQRSSGRRLAFAKHLTADDHPLTARVLVNRIWMHHMGRGLVATPGDFGVLGQRPTHPDLLDWLSRDFIDNGWDLKRLHRRIMTSTVYRQSSLRSDPNFDPENELYARQSVRRLEAETIRDAILSVSGQLSASGPGPADSVRSTDTGETVVPTDVDMSTDSRRSVYVQMRRSRPLAMLEVFDAPQLEPNCTLRTVSTVTPQSLLLMNSDVLIKQSEAFAKRLQKEAGDDRVAQIRKAWELAFADTPTEHEVAKARSLLIRQAKFFAERSNDKATLSPQLQALASLCQVLMGSNQFLYVD